MSDLSRNRLLVRLVEDAKKDGVRKKEYNVAGCVHPLRPQMTAKGQVPPGSTVAFAVKEACKSAGVSARLMKYGVAQIGTRDVEKGVTVWRPVAYKDWKKRKIAEGELLRFRLLPKGGGGGGGGKNPLRTILTVVVTIVAIAAAVYAPYLAPSLFLKAGGGLTILGGIASGVAGLAVSTIGMVLVNAIAPLKTPSASFGSIGNNRKSESQVYSVSAGQNSLNQWGRVPFPLGRGRFAPPKAASPYTETIGEDQYLHELLCLGIGDMDIKDLKIGTTPIEDFNDVAYEIYTYDPNNPRASQYYPTGKFQEDMNVQLKANVWSSRTSAECDSFEIDFGFQGLAWYDDRGNPTGTSVAFTIQYKTHTEHGWSDVGGNIVSATYSVTGSQSRLLRKTWASGTLPRGVYDVRVLRQTGDSTNDRLKNDSYWTALRSVTNDPPVATKYPVMLLAMRIKATGQLSGNIQTLTHYYETRCLDYDVTTDTWVHRPTSNPASLFRYVLQNGSAMARPQPDSVVDLPSLQEAHKFWAEKEWEYNFVCDADSSVFERLQSICAAGLGSPTMVDGKWAIIIDKPRDAVVCAFTSANSWAWSFKRTQVRLPNAIHCSFINERTWDSDMRVVPTDEPNTGNYVYETQDYEGVNKPDQVYQLARFHYADAKVRRRTISLRAYDEAIMCTRGDLVECACPSINPQGLQVGRVREVFRNDDGLVTHFTTDQQQTTDLSGRVFGVKVYLRDGTIAHAIVNPDDKSQRKITLYYPQAMPVESGDKYAFGDYNEETFQAIVLSLKYNADWTCDIVLQDYQPQIYGRLDEEIPDFKSVITQPIAQKWKVTSKPIIVKVTTNEDALLKTASVSIPRIMVDYKHPADLDANVKYARLEVSEEGMDEWSVAVNGAPITEIRLFAGGVSETKTYDIRMAYVSESGQIGDYVYATGIYIVGRTTPPPPVDSVFIEGNRLRWMQSNIPVDVVGYQVFMAMDYEDPFDYALLISNGYVTLKEFDIARWRGSSRALWVCAIDELGLRSDPRKCLVDLGYDPEENIVDTLYESSVGRNWPGSLTDGVIYNDSIRSMSNTPQYVAGVAQYKSGSPAYRSPQGSSFVYTTSFYVPDVGKANVRIWPSVIAGRLASVEYRVAQFNLPYMEESLTYSEFEYPYNETNSTEWLVVPDYIPVRQGELIRFRLTSMAGVVTLIPEITFVLDVPDAEPWSLEDYEVLAEDVRLPVPMNYFRWIKDVKYSLQYRGGRQGVNVLTVDKGIVNNNRVVEGPMIRVIDKDGNPVSGCIDVTVYGVSV